MEVKDVVWYYLVDYLVGGGIGIVCINSFEIFWCDDDLRLCLLLGVQVVIVFKISIEDDVVVVCV